MKSNGDGLTRQIVVLAFALRVASELEIWLEIDLRQRKWFTLDEAFWQAGDDEIHALIKRFAQQLGAKEVLSDTCAGCSRLGLATRQPDNVR